MYLESGHATIVSLTRASGPARRVYTRTRRLFLTTVFGVSRHFTNAALTILGISTLVLGLFGYAFDEAAANIVLPATAHHSIWWHWVLNQAAWFAGVNVAVGIAVAALAYFIAAQPKAQVIPFRRRRAPSDD